MPITSFADRTTLAIFEGRNVKGIGHQIAERAQVKLALLDGAVNRAELATPGADLKALKGKDISGRCGSTTNTASASTL